MFRSFNISSLLSWAKKEKRFLFEFQCVSSFFFFVCIHSVCYIFIFFALQVVLVLYYSFFCKALFNFSFLQCHYGFSFLIGAGASNLRDVQRLLWDELLVLAAFEHVTGIEDCGGILCEWLTRFALIVICGRRIRCKDSSVVVDRGVMSVLSSSRHRFTIKVARADLSALSSLGSTITNSRLF